MSTAVVSNLAPPQRGLSKRTYTFRAIDRCDMCGSADFRMLGLRLSTSQGRRPKAASGMAVSVKQCRRCKLVFADPQPTPASITDHYGVPPEEYWHPENIGVEEPHVAVSIATAKRLLDFTPGMKALDVGAGLGQTMAALTREGFDAHGIEPSEPFWRRLNQSRVKLSRIEDADFPAGSFDLITFGAVLEHLYSPSLALSRALQWLRPGGIVYVYVPSASWLIAKLVNSYFRLRGTNYVTHLSPMHVPFHLYEFTAESFRLNGERLGYEVADLKVDVCVVPHVPLKGLFHAMMERTGTGMMLAAYLRKPA